MEEKKVGRATHIIILENISNLTKNLPVEISKFTENLSNYEIKSSCLAVTCTYPQPLYTHVVYIEYDKEVPKD